MTKRILSLILTIAMVLSCVPFQVFAESIPTEVTEAATEEMLLPEAAEVPEQLEPEKAESEEPATTEPEAAEPEEPAATEPEAAEPEEPAATEPEATEPEATEVLAIEDLEEYAITEEDDVYYFETFEDLQKLCEDSYEWWTDVYYMGSQPLVIEEDLTVPEYVSIYNADGEGSIVVAKNVTVNLEDSFLCADSLTIHGTVTGNGGMRVYSALEVNGSLNLSGYLDADGSTEISGMDNILVDGKITRYVYVETFAEFRKVLAAAEAEQRVQYSITWSQEGSPVISESLKLSGNVCPCIYALEDEPVIISEEVTLDITADFVVFNSGLLIQGSLVNNGTLYVDYGAMTVAETGSYSGDGNLTVYAYDSRDTLEDVLQGLDMDAFEVTYDSGWEDDYRYWTLQLKQQPEEPDIPEEPEQSENQLPAPTDLKWDSKGGIWFVPQLPNQGDFSIKVYKEGQEDFIYNASFDYDENTDDIEEAYYGFAQEYVESGTYVFSVQSTGDGSVADSEIVWSEPWVYVKPEESLSAGYDLQWDWPYASWSAADDAASFWELDFLYAPSEDAELEYVTSYSYVYPEDAIDLAQWELDAYGPGYYYFRVRPLSEDITQIYHGDWSDLSPAYYYDGEQDWEEEETDLYFTTFAELQALCAQEREGWSDCYYLGQEPLVIREDLVLRGDAAYYFQDSGFIVPEGVTLYGPAGESDGYEPATVYAEEVTVAGTLEAGNRMALTAYGKLEVSGTLRTNCYINVHGDTDLIGRENIRLEEDGCIIFTCYVEEEQALLYWLETAAEENNYYDIFVIGEDPFTLTESVQIPGNVYLSVQRPRVILPQGIGLTVEPDGYVYMESHLEVAGSLENHGELNIQDGSLTITDTGSYEGSGLLSLGTHDESAELSQLISGLDLSGFQIREYTYVDAPKLWELTPLEGDVETELVASGTTGDLSWELDEYGQLRIFGQGATDDYDYCDETPWYEYSYTITRILVEEGVTRIGSYAFGELSNVYDVSLPDTLEQIGFYAFYDCISVEEMILPASLEEIEYNPFVWMTGLQEFVVEEGNPNFYTEDGVLFCKNGDTTLLCAYPGGREDFRYTVPEGVTVIFGGAFFGAYRLVDISLPESLEEIWGSAFGYTNLSAVTIPAGVTYIDDYAFESCYNLGTVVFQGDPPYMEENAFYEVYADVRYPLDNDNWTQDILLDYGGDLTWVQGSQIQITGEDQVLGGSSLKLSAQILPYGSAKISWSLAPEDEGLATLKASGNTLTLTAADVTELQTITVIASAEGYASDGRFQVILVPKAKALTMGVLWLDDDGYEQVDPLEPGASYGIDLDTWDLEETFSLVAEVLPEGASQDVTWSSSNTKVAQVDDRGILRFTGKAGTATITAKATDGSGTKVSTTWKAVNAPAPEPVGDTDLELAGGKSVTLKVRDAKTGKAITGKNVDWYLWTENGDASAYATINSSGKVTAKKVVEAVTVYACADIYVDGFYLDYVEYALTLHPAATHVVLTNEDEEPVNDQTLYFNLNDQDEMALNVVVLPFDAMDMELSLKNSDSGEKLAEYDYDAEEGKLYVRQPTGKTGTATLTFKTTDGSNKTGTVKIQFGRYAQDVEISMEQDTLVSGESMTLEAWVSPENVSKPGVVWSLADPGDKAYVNLSGNKLTARKVYGEKTVTLIATSKDGHASGTCEITVEPGEEGMLAIYEAMTEENVTKSTVLVDLNQEDREVYLAPFNYGEGTLADVEWSYRSSDKAYIYEQDGGLVVRMLKAGSVNITARDGRRTATVTVKAARLATEMELTTKNGGNLTWIDDELVVEVASGKSVELKALVPNADSSKVTWSILQGGNFAKISSSGKLTAAKNVAIAQEVVVQATAADGSGVTETVKVLVRPLATGIELFTLEEDLQQRTLSIARTGNQITRSNTTLLWDMTQDTGFRVFAWVYPFYGFDSWDGAMQDVTWKSSSAKVASIDEEGMVTCLKPGTTTITCTANDGSGQKISFKLTVVKRMQDLQLEDCTVVGGKSISMKPIIEPADTTNKNLTWEIYGDTAFAAIDQKGKLTTKKVTEEKTVHVYVYAQDGSELEAECIVTIYPKAVTSMVIWEDENNVTGKTLNLEEGAQLQFYAQCLPENQACQECIWTSSDETAVSVEDGLVTALREGATATITAAATDGSGKKATVKIKVADDSVLQPPAGKGSIYYLNHNPAMFDLLADLAQTYTCETGIPVTILTAASGTYHEVLEENIDKATIFNIDGQVGVEEWDDYALDLSDTALPRELITDGFNLYNDYGELKAMGFCYESFGIIVNTELLSEYGYTVADITDFDSLKAVAEQINAQADWTGVYAFADAGMDPSSSWRFTGHLANMPLFYEFRDRGVPGWTSWLNGNYMYCYKNLWDLYIENAAADPAELSYGSWMESLNQFTSGQAVFYQGGTWDYSSLEMAGMTDDQLSMIPMYCGAPGEENAGLCSDTQSHWAINANAAPEDIEASLHFLRWLVTDKYAVREMANYLGAMPFRKCPESDNKLIAAERELLEKGRYPVTWAFTYTPSVDNWRAGVAAALEDYSAGGSWETVESAFVDGWEYYAGW